MRALPIGQVSPAAFEKARASNRVRSIPETHDHVSLRADSKVTLNPRDTGPLPG
jgi:hypothetical protein